MHLSTLSEWLEYIASVHATEMDLGLERVKIVADRLSVLKLGCPVIIVGGTNGKGSTVAGLESIYRAAGYHVGAFTSPFLFKHNEYVRIDGQLASDEDFCDAYEKIEAARGDVTLTQFEFHTLAALLIFKNVRLDVMLLEVGLGGRLDAVNIIDADVSVVTSIGIDHTALLGSTREAIAIEKAGIYRQDKPAICGDPEPPQSLIDAARQIGAVLYCQQKEFKYEVTPVNWSWSFQETRYTDLALSTLATQNMSTVLMVITILQLHLPVTREAIDQGIKNVTLPGRVQVINGTVMQIMDVAHNPEAISYLAKRLEEISCYGKTLSVFSMLGDKDIVGSIKIISPYVDSWFVAPLKDKRAANMDTLQKAFKEAQIDNVHFYSSIDEAFNLAKMKAQLGDRIVVFGSFRTVADVCKANEMLIQSN